MCAQRWGYFVPYQDDVEEALEKLQQREFAAGRFQGADRKPADIDEAVAIMEEAGTASILDITHVADEPDFCAVAPMSRKDLLHCFGTHQPTRETIEANPGFGDELEQGHALYVAIFKGGVPHELYFCGMPFQ